LVFRGILFDALQSQWGAWVTLIASSLLFGLGHLRGYPSGILGACLATLFGFAMGVLRLWTGGLALPIAAHLVADATIYGILVHAGAV
jgi:membrane protease YdiL (CAAX protease family)